MTLTALNGLGLALWDDFLGLESGTLSLTNVVAQVDAGPDTEKFAFVGRVWHPDTKSGTIAIRKVHFRAANVTQGGAASSTFRISLQNVSATAGPPYQPDTTQDQTGDFVGGTNAVANGWNTTPSLSADRTVDLDADSIGDTNSPWVAVVGQWSAWQTGDRVDACTLSSNNVTVAPGLYLGGRALFHNGTSYSAIGGMTNVVLECSDGSYAFLGPGVGLSAISTTSIATNITARAAGLYFSLPVQVKIDRIGLRVLAPNGCDGTLTLYDSDGTSVLVAVDVDNDAVASAASGMVAVAHIPLITLAASTNYRLAWVPANTTAATLYTVDVNAAGMMDGLVGGQEFHYTERDSGGTWAQTTTKRPIFYLGIQSIHDGAGGAGSGGAHVLGGTVVR